MRDASSPWVISRTWCTLPSNNGDDSQSVGLPPRKTQKVKPQKKIPETDAIFEPVAQANRAADANPAVLRRSIDSQAKVKIGNLSRGDQARTLEANQADDHDALWESVLVPFGILDVADRQRSIYFGQSAETSDFIVDCLAAWWHEHPSHYPDIQALALDLDGGSAVRSHRTPFIQRLTQFVQATGLTVPLIDYPSYHSQYNPIERCWATLEHDWNGAPLTTLDEVLRWAANMTWNGVSPFVRLVEGIYPKQVSVPKHELKVFEPQGQRSESLPKWDISASPT